MNRYWSSLERYMALSSEDDVVAEQLAEWLVEVHRRWESAGRVGVIRWLDVGAGDGAKVAQALSRFAQRVSLSRLPKQSLEIVLVDRDQRFAEADELTHERASIRRVQGAWPAVDAEGASFSLITFVHSLYHFVLTPEGELCGLREARNLLAHDGLLAIVHESDKSEFYKFKRQFYPLVKGTLISTAAIRRAIPLAGLELKFSVSIRQYMELKSPGDLDEAFPWFLLATASSDPEQIDVSVQQSASTWLRRRLTKRGDVWRLQVDDCVFVAERDDGH
jgi:SAM-dependent methyltransferase